MKRRPVGDRLLAPLMLLLLLIVPVLLGAYLGYEWWVGEPDATLPDAPLMAAESAEQVVYRLDPARSEVRYIVNETFLEDNRLATAIGSTNGIAGDVRIDFASPANSTLGTIVINVEQFTSDRSLRDGAIRREFLESSVYPEARFVTTELRNFPDDPQMGIPFDLQIVGDLTVKETTRAVIWDATLTLNDELLTGSATTELLLSDFGVGPIELAGMLRTEDTARLEFDFTAQRVDGGDNLPALEATEAN